MPYSVSVGVCAHNEGRTIKNVLDAVLAQKTRQGQVKEVLVVSSGSTDDTNKIVRARARSDARVKLVTQKRKEGKASAVNLFLSKARSDVLILVSADVIPKPGCFNALLEPFGNPSVGMVTGRPVPDNDPDRFMGFTVHLIWRLHNQLQQANPKANEILAMRPLAERIDVKSAVDDLQLEAIIKEKGFTLVYRPDAVVANHGPETLRDLIAQRRRIISGYLHSRETRDYVPATMNKLKVFSTLLNNLDTSPVKLAWTLAAVAVEAYVRATANFSYYVLKRNPYNWDTVESTKKVKQ